MYIQRFYLYLNMTKPSELLVLSWARMNLEGRALRKSFLVGQVQRLFPTIPTEKPELEPMLLQVQSFSDGREYLANGLRSYADGLLDEAAEREFLTLYRVYQRQDVYRLWSGQLTDTAFFPIRSRPLEKRWQQRFTGRRFPEVSAVWSSLQRALMPIFCAMA